MRWLRRSAAGIALLLGGIAVGTAGIVVQANRSFLAGHEVPWGLVLTLVTLIVAVRGACWWARTRAAGVVVAAGWVLATLVLAAGNSAGDVLLPQDLRSQVYLFGGVVLAALAALVPLPARDDAVPSTTGRHATAAPGAPLPPPAPPSADPGAGR